MNDGQRERIVLLKTRLNLLYSELQNIGDEDLGAEERNAIICALDRMDDADISLMAALDTPCALCAAPQAGVPFCPEHNA